MWRTRLLLNAYERAISAFEPGSGSMTSILRSGNDRPTIHHVYKDLISNSKVGWRGVSAIQKRELIQAFYQENRDIADQEGISTEFYNLTRELLQRPTNSGPDIVLVAAVLEGSLEMRYARYAEITALQLFSELRQHNAKRVIGTKGTAAQKDYSDLLVDTLKILSPHVQETRITRAVNLVTAASLSGVHIGASTAALLLAHAAETKDLMAIEKIIKSIEEGVLLYYEGVRESPKYSLAVLKAYSAVPQQSVSLRKMLEAHESLHCSTEAHYGAVVEKCIEMGSDVGLKFIVKSKNGDGCLSEYMLTLKLRLLCSIGTDEKQIEMCKDLVVEKAKQNITRRDVALLSYWKFKASHGDAVVACKMTAGIYAASQQRGLCDEMLVPVLSVYSKAGDVKAIEDLMSAKRIPNCSHLIYEGYLNSRTRAEKKLFPIHHVIETSVSEAPEMPIPPIREFQQIDVNHALRNKIHRIQGQGPYQFRDHTSAGLQLKETTVRSPADEVIEAVKSATQRRSDSQIPVELSRPALSVVESQKEKAGSAPTGIYMAATRVDGNGIPIVKKKLPIAL